MSVRPTARASGWRSRRITATSSMGTDVGSTPDRSGDGSSGRCSRRMALRVSSPSLLFPGRLHGVREHRRNADLGPVGHNGPAAPLDGASWPALRHGYARGIMRWARSGSRRGLSGRGRQSGGWPRALGQVAEAPVGANDGDRCVGQAREIARQVARMGPAAVFVVGEVAHMMDESEAGSAAMAGTLPQRKRNGRPRDQIMPITRRTKGLPCGQMRRCGKGGHEPPFLLIIKACLDHHQKMKLSASRSAALTPQTVALQSKPSMVIFTPF